MKSSPWHSTERPEADSPATVYHDNTACKQGNLVGKNLRRYGTDNRSLCKRCASLDAAGR